MFLLIAGIFNLIVYFLVTNGNPIFHAGNLICGIILTIWGMISVIKDREC